MFKKYNSIENTYQQQTLDRIIGHGFCEKTFVVQEKVHGANLSYWTTDGQSFQAAKRTENLVPGEAFYNYELLLNDLQPKFARIWAALKTNHPDLKQLTLFGEIIGGNYPHEDVPASPAALPVQKGIYYSPNNLFYAFDILKNAETYLDVDEANKLFEQEQILHAKTLYRGSLNQCLEYPNSFASAIPAELGLPALQTNICEGVIIRSLDALTFNNGQRVILKNKNEKWAENKKFNKTIHKNELLPEKVLKLQEAIQSYVTENRLNNVLSKIGEISSKDFGKVLGLFNKDVVGDFEKDYRELVDGLEKQERKQINKSIGGLAAQLVRQKIQAG